MSPHSPLASIDIGSNSILLLVGRMHQGKLQIQRQRKETIRLGGALDAQGQLEAAAMERGLQCLRRYAELIRDIPNSHRRAVATQTLREASNRDTFLQAASEILQCRVELISGEQEARWIYRGVTALLPEQAEQRLVIDIGGRRPYPAQRRILCGGQRRLGAAFFPEWQPGCQRFCTGHTGSPAGAATCAGAAAHACLAAGLWLIRHSRCHQQSPASHG